MALSNCILPMKNHICQSMPKCHFQNGNNHDHHGSSLEDLPTGIYWGFARIGTTDPYTYKTACSIGYNPTYGNQHKTIEPHLIAKETDPNRHASLCGESFLGDFYGQPIRLSIVGYLRPELPFEGLEKLIEAIKNDIAKSDILGDGMEPETVREREWVASDEPLEATG